MSHTAIVALINNQSFATDFNAIEIVEFIPIFGKLIADYILNLFIFISIKYTEIFNNVYVTCLFMLFLVIICTGIKFLESCDYWTHMTEIEKQLRYLSRKNKFQEVNIEFLLDQKANNELKMTKLIKQMKKLQKEVNKYA